MLSLRLKNIVLGMKIDNSNLIFRLKVEDSAKEITRCGALVRHKKILTHREKILSLKKLKLIEN